MSWGNHSDTDTMKSTIASIALLTIPVLAFGQAGQATNAPSQPTVQIIGNDKIEPHFQGKTVAMGEPNPAEKAKTGTKIQPNTNVRAKEHNSYPRPAIGKNKPAEEEPKKAE